MFQSPEWIWLEILVIVLIIGFFATIIGVHIYKKVHHMPTGDCACCRKSKEKMLKEYHKIYSNK